MKVLSALAMRQLAKWEKLATGWPSYTDPWGFSRCAVCDLTIWRVTDNQDKPYEHSPAEILALTVAHLRNHHPKLDPNEETV